MFDAARASDHYVLEAAKSAPREVRMFCHVLHDTGRRLPEALTLPMRGVDLAGHCGERIKGIV